MDLQKRLIEFIQNRGLSINEFERKCGISTGYVHKVKNVIGKRILWDIQKAFPELNIDWLLTGEGEMQKTSQVVGDISNSNVSGVNVNGQEIHINPNAYDTLLKIVEANQKTTEKFQEQIDRLIGVIENKYGTESR